MDSSPDLFEDMSGSTTPSPCSGAEEDTMRAPFTQATFRTEESPVPSPVLPPSPFLKYATPSTSLILISSEDELAGPSKRMRPTSQAPPSKRDLASSIRLSVRKPKERS